MERRTVQSEIKLGRITLIFDEKEFRLVRIVVAATDFAVERSDAEDHLCYSKKCEK